MQFALEQVMKAQRRSTGIALLFLNLGARWDGWSTPRPVRFTPGKEKWYSLYRRLGETHRRSGRGLKISPPTGIRSPDRPSISRLIHTHTHTHIHIHIYRSDTQIKCYIQHRSKLTKTQAKGPNIISSYACALRRQVDGLTECIMLIVN